VAFKDISIKQATRLINHGPTVLITSRSQEKTDVMTAAWQMPVSHSPVLVAVAIGHTRFTHRLIEESREFVIAIPHVGMIEKVWCCGTLSGRGVDKFSHCGLTPVKGRKVDAPLIEECIGNIECRVGEQYPAGDHTIFVGEVVAASAREGLFDEYLHVDLRQAQTLHHLGGRAFCCPDQIRYVEI
jgi:flavin reductase (DIM6/NTAB) family NADH-FMN oxidoreductase RutF